MGIHPEAQLINSFDEVPDSPFFTNRNGNEPLSIDELQRGGSDELQRFTQRSLRTQTADLGPGVAQDHQGALDVVVGLIFTGERVWHDGASAVLSNR